MSLFLLNNKNNKKYTLDQVSGAVGAYSLRKLSKKYTGSCIRVRRGSDNTESDIGFSGDYLNISALLSFVGSGNGFVTKWYDQSGNNNHAIQTTQASQPQIVSSGILNTIQNKPTISYNGSSHSLTIPHNSSIDLNNPFSINIWFARNRSTYGAYDYLIAKNDSNSSSHPGFFINIFPESSGLRFTCVDGTNYLYDGISSSADITNNNLHNVIVSRNNLTLNGYYDRVLTTKTYGAMGNLNNTLPIKLCYMEGSYFKGYVSELILFNTDISNKALNLYDSSRGYFGI